MSTDSSRASAIDPTEFAEAAVSTLRLLQGRLEGPFHLRDLGDPADDSRPLPADVPDLHAPLPAHVERLVDLYRDQGNRPMHVPLLGSSGTGKTHFIKRLRQSLARKEKAVVAIPPNTILRDAGRRERSVLPGLLEVLWDELLLPRPELGDRTWFRHLTQFPVTDDTVLPTEVLPGGPVDRSLRTFHRQLVVHAETNTRPDREAFPPAVESSDPDRRAAIGLRVLTALLKLRGRAVVFAFDQFENLHHRDDPDRRRFRQEVADLYHGLVNGLWVADIPVVVLMAFIPRDFHESRDHWSEHVINRLCADPRSRALRPLPGTDRGTLAFPDSPSAEALEHLVRKRLAESLLRLPGGGVLDDTGFPFGVPLIEAHVRAFLAEHPGLVNVRDFLTSLDREYQHLVLNAAGFSDYHARWTGLATQRLKTDEPPLTPWFIPVDDAAEAGMPGDTEVDWPASDAAMMTAQSATAELPAGAEVAVAAAARQEAAEVPAAPPRAPSTFPKEEPGELRVELGPRNPAENASLGDGPGVLFQAKLTAVGGPVTIASLTFALSPPPGDALPIVRLRGLWGPDFADPLQGSVPLNVAPDGHMEMRFQNLLGIAPSRPAYVLLVSPGCPRRLDVTASLTTVSCSDGAMRGEVHGLPLTGSRVQLGPDETKPASDATANVPNAKPVVDIQALWNKCLDRMRHAYPTTKLHAGNVTQRNPRFHGIFLEGLKRLETLKVPLSGALPTSVQAVTGEHFPDDVLPTHAQHLVRFTWRGAGVGISPATGSMPVFDQVLEGLPTVQERLSLKRLYLVRVAGSYPTTSSMRQRLVDIAREQQIVTLDWDDERLYRLMALRFLMEELMAQGSPFTLPMREYLAAEFQQQLHSAKR